MSYAIQIKRIHFLSANIIMLVSNLVLSISNINEIHNSIISYIILLGFLLSIILFIASYFLNKNLNIRIKLKYKNIRIVTKSILLKLCYNPYVI